MDWIGLHVTYLHMINCSREWGVTENTQELNHDGLALESCLLVNRFHGLSLDATRHSSRASLLTLHAGWGSFRQLRSNSSSR
jgi:hypothetical protein